MEATAQTTKTLSHLYETAKRSYNWLSFDPEKRGQRVIDDYSNELDSDIKAIQGMGADTEQVTRYKNGYEQKLTAWLNSQSNCASSMIAGPANFPSARMQKRNKWADNHYNNFRAWREKVLAAYRRHEKKQKIEEAGGELAIAEKKLKNAEELQQYMKDVNKAHKAYLKNPQSLELTNLSEKAKQLIISYVPRYSWEPHPFAPYQLTNNNVLIKNTKQRVDELRKKEDAKIDGNKEFTFEGGQIVFNTELDRLQILHDQKPEAAVIAGLKSNGFRWSPFYKAWQRQLTKNAVWSLNRMMNLNIEF